MNSVLVYYGQDGEAAGKDVIEKFKLDKGDIKYIKEKAKDVFDFVGFSFSGDSMLAVFPKHYFTDAELQSLNTTHVPQKEDLCLLYETITRYVKTASSRAKANRYIGPEKEYVSDYPFAAFYRIYDYYQRYGLYKESEDRIVEGNKGKISWKESIHKSQKIVSGGNLIFAPLYVRKKNYQQVFVTECMAFVIDHTINHFSLFLSMKRTGYHRGRFDFLANIPYVLQQLREAEQRIFKDINKKLIRDLIIFFEQYEKKCLGGKIHVKINYFNLVWQNMIEKYLNMHFSRIDNITDEILFDHTLSSSPVRFEEKEYHMDASSNDFYIVVDHLGVDRDKLYIFDSKYYFEVNELNYKQYSYNEILRYYFSGISNMYSALILPGRRAQRIHFEMNGSFAGPRIMGSKIVEQYVEPRDVMQTYVE